MRLFEFLLFLLCIADALSRIRFAARRPIWTSAIPMISFLCGIIHIAGESGRWQMIPIYLVVLSTFAMSLLRLFQTGEIAVRSDRLARGTGSLIVLLAVGSLTSGTALPVFDLPIPSGDYVVGVVESRLGDTGIGIRVHYPSDKAHGERDRYATGNLDRHIAYLSSHYGLPVSLLGHLSLVRTFSFPTARLSDELPQFRVLIACPDVSRPSSHATALTEDLASREFVVITIPEPGIADTSALEDPGREVSRYVDLMEELVFGLEALGPKDEIGWLADRLDLARIGVYGLDQAGSAVIAACSGGTFRAGASVGFQPASTRPDVPFLYIHPENTNDPLPDDVTAMTYSLTIRGAMIDNFGDDAFVSPLMPALGQFGPIDSYRASQITGAYLGAFFNKHLTRGTVEPILDGPAEAYPEVTLQIRDPEE